MGKPSAPKAPDPKETAAAQTSTNVATAIANSYLGNVNQVTPDGKLTYDKTGQNFIADDNGQQYWRDRQGNVVQSQDPSKKGTYTSVKGYYTPTFTATQTLSPQQQAIKTNSDKTSEHLARTAREQAWNMRNFLNTSIDTSNLPAANDWSKLNLPTYTKAGSGPDMKENLGDAGKIQTSIGNAGNITKSYGTDYGANVKQVQDAMMSRLQPNIDRDRASLETNLQNQGIRIGSDAWTNAMADFDRGVNDQRTSVLLSSGQEQSRLAGLERDRAMFENSAQGQNFDQLLSRGTFGNTAQQQQFGQNMDRAQFQNTSRQQEYDNTLRSAGFNNALADQRFNATVTRGNQRDNARTRALEETFALRNQPINEVSSLLSGGQVTQPNFMNIQGQTMPTVDYAGLVQQDYGNQMGAYNAQMAQRNSILGGLFGLGASGIMASDRRLKSDIRRIGTYRNGLPKYEFRYRHGQRRFIGVMSDDVRKVRPEAVTRIDGYDVVNYRKALA